MSTTSPITEISGGCSLPNSWELFYWWVGKTKNSEQLPPKIKTLYPVQCAMLYINQIVLFIFSFRAPGFHRHCKCNGNRKRLAKQQHSPNSVHIRFGCCHSRSRKFYSFCIYTRLSLVPSDYNLFVDTACVACFKVSTTDEKHEGGKWKLSSNFPTVLSRTTEGF